MRRRYDDQDMPQPISVFIGTLFIGPFLVGIMLYGMVFAVNAGRSLYDAVHHAYMADDR